VSTFLLIATALYAAALLVADRIERDRQPGLRRISFYERLRAMMRRALEAADPIHASLGSGSVLTAAPQALAASAVARVTGQVTRGVPPALVTCGSPTLLVTCGAALESLHGAAPETQPQLLGTEPLAFAVGGWEATANRALSGEVYLGPFGVDGLLLAEGAQADVPERLAGVANLDVAGTLLLGASDGVVGEDVYAASAYTGERPRLGGLAVQDGLRVALVLAMLVGLALCLAKLGGG